MIFRRIRTRKEKGFERIYELLGIRTWQEHSIIFTYNIMHLEDEPKLEKKTFRTMNIKISFFRFFLPLSYPFKNLNTMWTPCTWCCRAHVLQILLHLPMWPSSSFLTCPPIFQWSLFKSLFDFLFASFLLFLYANITVLLYDVWRVSAQLLFSWGIKKHVLRQTSKLS